MLNYSGQESKKQFAVHGSDTPVTLKQGQCHQTLYELGDSKQCYDNAQCEKLHFNSTCERANDKFLSNQETCEFPLNMSKCKTCSYIHDLLCVLNNPTKFQLNQIRS